MPWCRSTLFNYLTIIHSLIVFTLLSLITYIVTVSLIDKHQDCGFIFRDCYGKTTTRDSLNNTTLIYDWIGLDQILIISLFVINLLFGYISSLCNYRKCILLATFLYFSYLVHLLLIEFNDYRRNQYRVIDHIRKGATIHEKGSSSLLHSRKNHILIETNDSKTNLIIKYILAGLSLLELIFLRISFGLTRYRVILGAPEKTLTRTQT